MRLCYYPAPSGVCPFTHVKREKLPAGSERYYHAAYLHTYLGIVDHSEFVTHVITQNLHAATQACCGGTRVTSKNLHAANFVTCPPVRRNIPGFPVDPPYHSLSSRGSLLFSGYILGSRWGTGGRVDRSYLEVL